MAYTLATVEKDVPTIYQQAKISGEAKDLKGETDSLHKNSIWELVILSKWKKVIGCK